jgi:hypothetical protein
MLPGCDESSCDSRSMYWVVVPEQEKKKNTFWVLVECTENGTKYKAPKKVSYMNLETKKLRGRPRNRWQDEVRGDGRLVGGKGWKVIVYNREELKKLLRTARNHRILRMSMD